jgi:UDP-glucose-4-epimerase GalE
MRVLVTGGAGYIGSHAAKALTEAGYEPVVLDDLSNGHREAVGEHPLVVGSIGDAGLVRDTIQRYETGAVLHFAASAYVGESVRDPRKYFDNNVTNTLTLLRVMLDEGVKTIVFSSSCATYGITDGVPVAEDAAQSPVNPYGWSKLMVEQILKSYDRAYDLRWMALRYFNAAGADEEGKLGERHEPETHLIPLLIQAALGLRPAVEIFGTDYPTEDGTAVRDYVHVSDLAEAHVLGLKHLLDGKESMALNLGSGTGHSVKQLVAAVGAPVLHARRREGDPAMLVADPARAKAILGWEPRRSGIENIVRTAWAWHSSLAG